MPLIDDDEPCGEQFEIDAVDLIANNGEKVREIPGVTLVCSRPINHTPAWIHSDGATDWLGDEERN